MFKLQGKLLVRFKFNCLPWDNFVRVALVWAFISTGADRLGVRQYLSYLITSNVTFIIISRFQHSGLKQQLLQFAENSVLANN